MKRVLVTGATGFIGRACLEPLLARGFEVHAVRHQRTLSVGEPGAAPAGVVWHACDLLAPEGAGALMVKVKPTHLLHLAWYAVPGKYWISRENIRWVRASLALYEAFVASGGMRVVMAGSSAEYDWSQGICREGETPLLPRTYYGTCKHALDLVVAADAARADVSAAWARYFFLFGPHESAERLVSSVILSLLQGQVARCSPGTQKRDFLHVADAAEATVALLDSQVRGPVNVASGDAVAVSEVAERLALLVGGAGRIHLGALPADPNDPPLVVADVRRLRQEVGFAPKDDRDERLRQTIEWWRTRDDRGRQQG